MGATGATGTTGQSGTMVWGTSSLTVTNLTFADIPGLTATFTVPNSPAGSFVYISTDGGTIPAFNCAVADCSVIVDVQVVVDGAAAPVHGGFQRISAMNSGWQNPTEFWGISQVLTLAPGAHTVKVQARLAGQRNTAGGALVSAGDASTIQGELNVLVLNR